MKKYLLILSIILLLGCINPSIEEGEIGDLTKYEKIIAPNNEDIEIFFPLLLSGTDKTPILNASSLVNLTRIDRTIIFKNENRINNFENGSYSLNLNKLNEGEYVLKIFLWEGLKNYTKNYHLVIE